MKAGIKSVTSLQQWLTRSVLLTPLARRDPNWPEVWVSAFIIGAALDFACSLTRSTFLV